MSYIDGYLVPVPTKNKQTYRDLATKMLPLWKEYGALSVMESWGDDTPAGKVTDFPRAVQATADETVVFSWIVWPSKQVRDAAQVKMKTDPRMKMEMPFDGKRMILGGFEVIVDSSKK
jgi:uncharacterized protein YbaA (DUF1428 family)